MDLPIFKEEEMRVQRGSGDHSATATTNLRQLSGPGPSAPLLTFKGSEPGQLQVCPSCMWEYTAGGTHSTVEFEPKPLGDKPLPLSLLVERVGKHTGSGMEALVPTSFSGPA